MKSLVYKLSITAHILVTNDDDSISEIVTKPISVYRGTDFGIEQIEQIEKITLQEIENKRS